VSDKRNEYIPIQAHIDAQNADAAYQAMIAEGERRFSAIIAKRLAQLKPMQEELHALGVTVRTPEELLQRGPVECEVVDVLLKWLLKEGLDPAIYVSILIGLHKPRNPFHGGPLVEFFERPASDVEDIRWNVGYTIAQARPYGISQWIIDTLKNSALGSCREWLAIAAARIAPGEDANPVLRQVFHELPDFAAEALGISGTEEDMHFLTSQLSARKGRTKKAIERAIKKIGKRVTV
jgi:hypothetical protein